MVARTRNEQGRPGLRPEIRTVVAPAPAWRISWNLPSTSFSIRNAVSAFELSFQVSSTTVAETARALSGHGAARTPEAAPCGVAVALLL